MAPIKDEEAIGRTVMLALRSPVITALLGLSVGGGGATFLSNRSTNAQLDTLTQELRESRPAEARIRELDARVINQEGRVTKLEMDTTRLAWVESHVGGNLKKENR